MDSELACESGPRHTRANAVIVLSDPVHRLPIAIMEGALISAMRTAVVQALAARYLARPDAQSIGLGAGRNCPDVWALSKWFPNVTVFRAYDQNSARLDAFVSHMARQGIGIEPARDSERRSATLISALLRRPSPSLM